MRVQTSDVYLDKVLHYKQRDVFELIYMEVCLCPDVQMATLMAL